MNKQKSIKRLFFDIETSPNIVYSWNVGYYIKLEYSNIIKERAIICICYKWENDSKVRYLTWNNGDDNKMINEFFQITKEADEIIGHNGDKFDLKWFRTRAIYHGILNMPEIKSIDTLKISRKYFRFNSNRLDYIGKYLGLGGKINERGFDLWKNVIENNNKAAMREMVKYCSRDVILLESIYNKLVGYSKPITHVGVHMGNDKNSCPRCGSIHLINRRNIISTAGIKKKQKQCKDCGGYSTHLYVDSN